jgi:hypothetical protein
MAADNKGASSELLSVHFLPPSFRSMARFLGTLLACAALLLAGARAASAQGSCTSKGGAGCGGASGIQCCEGLFCDLIPPEAQTGTTAGFCKFSTPGGR